MNIVLPPTDCAATYEAIMCKYNLGVLDVLDVTSCPVGNVTHYSNIEIWLKDRKICGGKIVCLTLLTSKPSAR